MMRHGWAPKLLAVLIALPLALAACHRAGDDSNLDTLDAELANKDNAANAKDPALVSALQDQIMVDPQLTQQANRDAIRPPGQPYSAPIPPDATRGNRPGANDKQLKHAPDADPKLGCPQCRAAKGAVTLGALASRQADKRTNGCAARVQYSTGWANRLPADVPLYPNAHVTEAAGNASGDCALRIVSFSSSDACKTVIDWYYTHVTRANYSAEHRTDGGQHVLGGTRDRDGGAYVIYVTPRADGGSDVDLVTNNGS
jgi:hypothetical protein